MSYINNSNITVWFYTITHIISFSFRHVLSYVVQLLIYYYIIIWYVWSHMISAIAMRAMWRTSYGGRWAKTIPLRLPKTEKAAGAANQAERWVKGTSCATIFIEGSSNDKRVGEGCWYFVILFPWIKQLIVVFMIYPITSSDTVTQFISSIFDDDQTLCNNKSVSHSLKVVLKDTLICPFFDKWQTLYFSGPSEPKVVRRRSTILVGGCDWEKVFQLTI